jgi:hypothetical protein
MKTFYIDYANVQNLDDFDLRYKKLEFDQSADFASLETVFKEK